MSLIAILAALGLEQWHAFHWRASIERAFVLLARRLEQRLNGGTRTQGSIALLIAVVPPVVLAAALWWAADTVHPLLGLLANIVVLYCLMGFRRFSHAAWVIWMAWARGDVPAARRALAGWRGGWTGELGSSDIAKLSIERGFIDAYRQVFAVVFWFLVLPGASGAVLYRAAALLAEEWKGSAPGDDTTPIGRSRTDFGWPARKLLAVLDWLPARLTALSFAIVGDFEDAVSCWRTQPKDWPASEGGATMGIVLASGAGALGVRLGGPVSVLGGEPDFRPEIGMGDAAEPDMLPSAVGLVWRAVVVWMLLILLVTVAYVAP